MMLSLDEAPAGQRRDHVRLGWRGLQDPGVGGGGWCWQAAGSSGVTWEDTVGRRQHRWTWVMWSRWSPGAPSLHSTYLASAVSIQSCVGGD